MAAAEQAFASRESQGIASQNVKFGFLHGLEAARECLGTQMPAEVANRLAAPGPREVSAAYLSPGRIRQHLTDLRAVPGWGERLHLFREWLFPPADYLLRKYDTHSRWLLPWLYLRRGVAGIARRWS